MKDSTRLKKARALIADPKFWTQGTYRRRKRVDGELVYAHCALGAIRAVTGGGVETFGDGRVLTDQLNHCSFDLFKIGQVHRVNDGVMKGEADEWGYAPTRCVSRAKAHKNVLAVYDCAIAKLTAAEKAEKAAKLTASS